MEDERYMKMALALAEKGVGYVNPNPLVGAILVKDRRVIGEGWHENFGGPHGEINAILNAEKNGESVKGATLYVTLEPCSHFGKTPPCANTIIEKGIKKVVAAMEDPNPEVSGRGLTIMREHKIQVVTGILEEESRKMNEIFIKYITKKQPFCILKAGMTLDGKIATCTGDSKWVTGEASRAYVHRIRHRVSGIMVGIGTLLADDPSLTTRLSEGNGADADRIIVDSKGRTPLDSRVMTQLLASKGKTIVAVTSEAPKENLKRLEAMGAEIIITPEVEHRVDLNYLMIKLGERGMDSVLLEGGSELNYSALEAGVVDKVNIFIAPKIIGGRLGITPVNGTGKALMKDAWELDRVELLKFGQDIMIEGYIRK